MADVEEPQPPVLPRIASGDKSAMPECLSRYGGLVWSLALRYCDGDRSEAEDATQEIFVDVWSSCDRFDPDRGTEETFIALIARRRLIDRRRRASRRPLLEELAFDLTEPQTRDAVEDRDESERALRLLGEMDPETRRLLILSIHHGRTHEEIAMETNLPLGTVKTRLRRGLIRLRDRLRLESKSESQSGATSAKEFQS